MGDSLTQLPQEPVDRFTRPFMRFLRVEAMAGIILLMSTLAALLLSNTEWSTQFLGFWDTSAGFRFGGMEFSRTVKHWINDGLMTLFFFVIALELKRELVLGELRNPRLAAFPLAAAIGGMVVPVAVYAALVGGGPGAGGWGSVMSTDTAFLVGCLTVLGSRIPASLRLFLLFSVLAIKLRLGVRPAELSWSILASGSLLTGIGFTMALFIAEFAFDPALLGSVKLGVLGASVISAAGGFLALAWLTSAGRRKRTN